MEQSLFLDEVKKYFPGLAARVITRLNDTTNTANASKYRFRQLLRPELSTNLRWESITVNGTAVAADVIAMDSSIPLKRRDSIARANGEVPKIAMEMALREKELTELDILAAQPGQTQQLLAKLFRDTDRVITGIYETLEMMFLQGLSTGVAVVPDTQNVGLGVRVDYGYQTANKFGVTTLWSNPASTPFSDLARAQAKATADGNIINLWRMDRNTFNNLAKTDQAKQMWAAFNAFAGTSIPVPTLSQINQASQDRYGFGFEIIERSIMTERNGVRTPVTPWAAGQVVGTSTDQLGTVTYGILAEMNHPVENVNYTTVENFILVSKYRQNRPSLAEFTSSQALVVPVINAVDSIYTVDSLTVQA
jgi:hypothetical protein